MSDDGSRAVCQRVESPRRWKDAGWLHVLHDDGYRPPRRTRYVPLAVPEAETGIDFTALAKDCQAAAGERLHSLAAELSVSLDSLHRLVVGWSVEHRAWTFPMRDATGRVVGIRLRLPQGRKYSVRGGHAGLFLPLDLPEGVELLFLPEGASDTAAILDLGFAAAGRPSCDSGVSHIVGLVRRLKAKQAIVVADADEPGQRGAANLATTLLPYVPSVRTITPPAKDMRDWSVAGAKRDDVLALVDAAPVRRLGITSGKAVRA